jgi:hypothetical protein
MKTCLDANVLNGYRIHLANGASELTADPSRLLLTPEGESDPFLFIDAQGHIQNDCCGSCGTNWVEALIGNLLIEDKLARVNTVTNRPLERSLRDLGMPQTRDKWYIRACLGAKQHFSKDEVQLITEDLDFYDPRRKKSAGSRDLLKGTGAPVQRLLLKNGIVVRCVEMSNAADGTTS